MEDLEKRGINCWLDRIEIRGGDSLLEKISKGIESCDGLLAFLSENSINSRWVQFELEQAMRINFNGRNFKIGIKRKISEIGRKVLHLFYQEFRRTPGDFVQKEVIHSLISNEEINDIDFEAAINYLEQKLWIALKKTGPDSWLGEITHSGIEEIEK